MNSILHAAFLNGAGAVTLLALLLWANSLWQLYRAEILDWRRWWKLALASVIGAAFAFCSTKVDFKVLSDETNLLSVANMLVQFGKASNTEQWTYYYHLYHALDVSVPSRPILFPLLTALVHGLNGMRWWSPFVVNFVCLSALFFLTLSWARDRLNPALPRVALAFLALAMSPVLLINATSAGFDLCSLTFGFLAALLLQRHLRDGSEASLHALFYTLVCFASVRYESIVALPLVGAALLWKTRKIPWSLYLTCGFFLLPLFLQRYLTWGSFENPPGVPAFSPMHFIGHFPAFAEAFFLDPRGPYPIVIHWLGLAGVFLALTRMQEAGRILAAYMAFLFVLLLSHHFGFAGHPTQVRLFLPLSFGLTLMALYFLSENVKAVEPRALLGVFAILLYHHHQYAVSDPLMSQLTMTREVRHVRDFLDEASPTNRDLFIYDRPGQLTALGRSAISVNHFNGNEKSFLENLDRDLYGRLIVIEKVSPGRPAAVTGPFRLEVLRRHQLTPEETLQIAEVVPTAAASAVQALPADAPKPAPGKGRL